MSPKMMEMGRAGSARRTIPSRMVVKHRPYGGRETLELAAAPHGGVPSVQGTDHQDGDEAGRDNGPVALAVEGSLSQEKAVKDEVA